MNGLETPVPAAQLEPAAVPGALLAGRVRRWTGILAAYFSAQTLIQLAGILAGLLLVRYLPVREFALYTLAASVLGFFTFATDLGSTGSLLHFFHQGRSGAGADAAGEFAAYRTAVLSLRRGAFALGAVVMLAVFPAAAAANDYAAAHWLPMTAAILACVWFQIGSSLRLLDLRLHDRYGPAYRAELAGGALRLVLTLGLVAASWLAAWPAMVATALGSALVFGLARGGPTGGAAPPAGDLGRYRRQVLRYLLPTLPSALYFATRGPLTVWLAATFGGARNIAEVGALGRLGLVVGLFSGLTGVVFLPRLAGIADERLYRRRYAQFGGLLLAIALTLFAAAAAAPAAFLWLLGAQYSGLWRELLLVVGAAGLALLGGYVVSVNLQRSWTRWQALTVLLEIVVLAAGVALLPLSTTTGVLTLGLLCVAAGVLLQMVVAYLGFRRPAWVLWHHA